MEKFIKLHVMSAGQFVEVYVSVSKIIAIGKDPYGRGTYISIVNDDNATEVAETPEEILALINGEDEEPEPFINEG